MSKERELVRKSLIALEDAHLHCDAFQDADTRLSVIYQIKELLDQPEHIEDKLAMVEPVAWVSPLVIPFESYRVSHPCVLTSTETTLNKIPLYLAPPTRKPLSDEEIVKLWANKSPANEFECVRLVEKEHGIGVGNE